MVTNWSQVSRVRRRMPSPSAPSTQAVPAGHVVRFRAGMRTTDPALLTVDRLECVTRAEHATRYLQNKRLPLSSIAYMVGFSDASNFRRAYQKWTGKAPRDVRRG